MKWIFTLLIALLSTTARASSHDALAKSQTAFTFSFFSSLQSKENCVFSPYSIYSNLALLSCGAEGATKAELEKSLFLFEELSPATRRDSPTAVDSPANSAVSDKGCAPAAVQSSASFLEAFHEYLTCLNTRACSVHALFIKEDPAILPSFKELSQNFFNTAIYGQMQSVEEINAWVSAQTRGHIPHLLEENDVDDSTSLISLNALYFEGKWRHPFSSKMTKKEAFYTEQGPVLTPMMHQTASFNYFEEERFQMLSLPFLNEPSIECVVVLPKEPCLLEDLEKTLSSSLICSCLERQEPTLISASLPSFYLHQKMSLKEPLKKLGIHTAFSCHADFSPITENFSLFLNKVLHETTFYFHESGVTCSAATSAILGIKSYWLKEAPLSFTANRPFLFMMIDRESSIVLFMGHVLNPTVQNTL